MHSPLSVRKTLAGRHIFLTGASGFLGKVWLTMMLDQVPDVGRIYLLLRGKQGQDPASRFETIVNESFAFERLHERYGAALGRFLAERVEIVEGDLAKPGLGIDPVVRRRLQRDLDVVVHCAGQVDFNPDIREALATNFEGTLHAAELADSCHDCSFVQVSTCYVAGNKSGDIPEVSTPDFAPLRAGFDVDAEYAYLRQLVASIEEDTVSPRALDRLRGELEERIAARSKTGKANQQLVDRILKRESQAQLESRMVDAGRERAEHWGWPNIYTYTKSMAEAALHVRFPRLRKAIFRPSIIESAVSFPMPGWNEDMNTSGPLIYFMGTWFRHLPVKKDKPLDVVPVDYCCASLIAVTAALLDGRSAGVYHCGTSHRNPLSVGRGLELSSLAHRKHLRKHGDGAVERVILSRWDGVAVDEDHFMTIPNLRKIAQKTSDWLGTPSEGLPEGVRKQLKKITSRADRIDRRLAIIEKVFETFRPFTLSARQVFLADNLRALEVEEPFFRFEPEKLDWRDYWINVHVPGLRRWSFPLIENSKVETFQPAFPVRFPTEEEQEATSSRGGARSVEALRPTVAEAPEV